MTTAWQCGPVRMGSARPKCGLVLFLHIESTGGSHVQNTWRLQSHRWREAFSPCAQAKVHSEQYSPCDSNL